MSTISRLENAQECETYFDLIEGDISDSCSNFKSALRRSGRDAWEQQDHTADASLYSRIWKVRSIATTLLAKRLGFKEKLLLSDVGSNADAGTFAVWNADNEWKTLVGNTNGVELVSRVWNAIYV